MQSVKMTAKTVEEAVKKALLELGIEEADADIRVIEEGTKGIFGLGKKDAVVEVSVKGNVSETAPEEAAAAVAAIFAAEEETKPEEEPAKETTVETESAEEKEPAAEPAAEIKDDVSEADAEKTERKREERAFSKEEQDETAEEAKKFLEGIFRAIGLSVTMEKMANEDRILLNLHGDGLGILIGKRGRTLASLQYLTNLAAGKQYHHRYFVLLDVENYRIRREQTLTTLALRLADKAKRTGAPVALEPMDPAERRMIHLALQEDPDVMTESEGEGSYRHIVILPKM